MLALVKCGTSFYVVLWTNLAAHRTPRAAALGAASEEAGDLDNAVLHYAAAAAAAQGDEAGLAHSALGATFQQLAMADGHFDQVSAWEGASLQSVDPLFFPARTVLLAYTRAFDVSLCAHVRVHWRQLLRSLHQTSTINRQLLAVDHQKPPVANCAIIRRLSPTTNNQPSIANHHIIPPSILHRNAHVALSFAMSVKLHYKEETSKEGNYK
jgi:hypothetical protein